MSFSCTAYVVVGIKIPKNRLYVETVESVHKKCANIGTGKFCSTCGVAVDAVDTVIEPIPSYRDEGDELCGLGVYDIYDEGAILLGIKVAKLNSDSLGDARQAITGAAALEQQRELIRLSLEPLALWDEQQFGVWLYMWCG